MVMAGGGGACKRWDQVESDQVIGELPSEEINVVLSLFSLSLLPSSSLPSGFISLPLYLMLLRSKPRGDRKLSEKKSWKLGNEQESGFVGVFCISPPYGFPQPFHVFKPFYSVNYRKQQWNYTSLYKHKFCPTEERWLPCTAHGLSCRKSQFSILEFFSGYFSMSPFPSKHWN